jgi:hypothetical protein
MGPVFIERMTPESSAPQTDRIVRTRRVPGIFG